MRVRLLYGLTFAAAVALIVPKLDAQAQETSRAVAGGGISVAGWTGKVDASRENGTLTINDGKFVAEGQGFHVTTGPSALYWNPKNTATGDYTVSATFNEPKYQSLNDHPHPYGIAIDPNAPIEMTLSVIEPERYADRTPIGSAMSRVRIIA